MKEAWNERYSSEEYQYGKEPNKFFADNIAALKPGKILLPAEGEGRNAVFAAKLGWDVHAFDISEKGREKALKLAEEAGVSISYTVADFGSYNAEEGSFDCLALIFAHMHESVRMDYHRRLVRFLKPGGILLLEAYSKKQLTKSSGGPQDLSLLYTEDQLKMDFIDFEKLDQCSTLKVLKEGLLHSGLSETIQVCGTL
jgi:ubiquinone/menaquinone biosynthesis C-methylase UbiE